MSEQKAEQTSGESGSLGAGPAVPNPSVTPGSLVAAMAQEPMPTSTNVESPKLAPEHGGAGELPKVDAPKADALKADLMADLLKAGPPKADVLKFDPLKVDVLKAIPLKTEALKADPVKAEALKPDPVKPDPVKADPVKAGPFTTDTPKASAPRISSMSNRDRTRSNTGARPELDTSQDSPSFGKRRIAAFAVLLAVGAVAGALGGALATAGLPRMAGDAATTSDTSALEASVARIDADILALKASVEQTAKLGMTQFNKTSDRLDKVEKAQAEPAAKLARLGEAADKPHATPAAPAAVAAAPVAAKEVTGSIAPLAPTPAIAPKSEMAKSEMTKSEMTKSEMAKSEMAKMARAEVPKSEMARLPTVEGWVLREVAHGAALIEGRRGMFEVYAGDPIPGLGRVDAIRRQDGRWVVVTSKGLIVTR